MDIHRSFDSEHVQARLRDAVERHGYLVVGGAHIESHGQTKHVMFIGVREHRAHAAFILHELTDDVSPPFRGPDETRDTRAAQKSNCLDPGIRALPVSQMVAVPAL
jgi:hypothetical protein